MPIIPFSSRSDTELLQIIAGALVDPVTLEPIPIAGVVAFSDITGNPSDNSALDAALDAKAPLISPAFTTPDIGDATGSTLTLSRPTGQPSIKSGAAGYLILDTLAGTFLGLNYYSSGDLSLVNGGGRVIIGVGVVPLAKAHVVFADGENGVILAGDTKALRITANSVGIVLSAVDAATATTSYEPMDITGSSLVWSVPGGGRVTINANGVTVSGALNGSPIKLIKTATATLDFGSTAAGTSSDLTIALTGAAVGDTVALGVPNGSVVANGSFSAWVSAADVVTVRFLNSDLVSASDPASGTFRATIVQF